MDDLKTRCVLPQERNVYERVGLEGVQSLEELSFYGSTSLTSVPTHSLHQYVDMDSDQKYTPLHIVLHI